MKVEIQTCDGCGIVHPGDEFTGSGHTGCPMMPRGSWIGITFGHHALEDYGVDQDLYVCSLDCLVVAARKLRGFTVDPVVDPLELAFAAPAAPPAVKKPRAARKPRTT